MRIINILKHPSLKVHINIGDYSYLHEEYKTNNLVYKYHSKCINGVELKEHKIYNKFITSIYLKNNLHRVIDDHLNKQNHEFKLWNRIKVCNCKNE